MHGLNVSANLGEECFVVFRASVVSLHQVAANFFLVPKNLFLTEETGENCQALSRLTVNRCNVSEKFEIRQHYHFGNWQFSS